MPLIGELLARYEDYLTHERGLAEQTIMSYLGDLRRLQRFGNVPVEAINRDHLRAFMRHMSSSGLAVATIRRTFHGFGTFWSWLKLEGISDKDVTHELQLPRLNKTAPRWMSEDELRLFANTPVRSRNKRLAARDVLAWKTLAWLGLRRQELLSLKIEDVHLEDGVLVVRNTKSKQDRALAIPDDLHSQFEAICAGRGPQEYVFGLKYGRKWGVQPFNARFKRHLKACGLADRGITPHTLRHSFATHLVMRGVTLHVVKDLLGHKDLASTQIYLHADPQHLKDALNKHPLMTGAAGKGT